VAVVKGLGGTIPWVPRPTSPYMTLTTRLVNASVNRMAGGAINKGSLRLIMPNGSEVTYGDAAQVYYLRVYAYMHRHARARACTHTHSHTHAYTHTKNAAHGSTECLHRTVFIHSFIRVIISVLEH